MVNGDIDWGRTRTEPGQREGEYVCFLSFLQCVGEGVILADGRPIWCVLPRNR
jgi:hypothetical protein